MTPIARNRVCVWIILIGLINFVAFVVMYIYIGGDAKNGKVFRDKQGKVRYLIQMRGAAAERERLTTAPDDRAQVDVNGKFFRVVANDVYHEKNGTPWMSIGKGLYIYSCVHSLLVWITVAAVMLAMLTLAKDQLVTAMEDTPISGRAIIHVVATVVVITVTTAAVIFLVDFIRQMRAA